MKRKNIFGLIAAITLLGSGVYAFATNTGDRTNISIVDENWEYTPSPSNPDPLEPSNYSPGSTDHCNGASDLCGIKAPADANGEPVITPGSPLASRINNLDSSQGDVFLEN